MLRKSKIGFQDVYPGCNLAPYVTLRAAKAVAIHTEGCPKDGARILDMLGLIPPMPGNEPKTIIEHKQDEAKSKRKLAREARKEAWQAEHRDKERKALLAKGITPDEYGEI